MAYYSGMNYGLPVNYQTPALVQQPVMSTPQVQNSQQTNAGIIWVQGEAGAKAFPVQPGNSVLLMDSESECFYIKTTDASGVPLPLRTFAYNEIVQTQPVPQSQSEEPAPEYVTRAEFNEIKQLLEDIKASSRTTRKESRNEQIIPRNATK